MASVNISIRKEAYDFLNQFSWYLVESKRNLYARTHNGERKVLMHRMIMKLGNGNEDKRLVDHIDNFGLNCQKYNMRVCNTSQNNRNRDSALNKTSNYLGVCWHKRDQLWVAQIRADNKPMWIGNFKTEIEAAKAYNKEAIQLHGEFANLNTFE